MLEKVYGCTVFHMDDFFLRPEQRTEQRYAEAGGNVDRERFLEEVLQPLDKKETVRYRRFDCSTQSLGEYITVEPQKLTVVEGAYSMHPELAPYYDLSVFLDITEECRRERILKRNSPQFAQMFFERWIPLERVYFEKMDVKERCGEVIHLS
jgi:uridine kinase